MDFAEFLTLMERKIQASSNEEEQIRDAFRFPSYFHQ